jgi:hypothetical protein
MTEKDNKGSGNRKTGLRCTVCGDMINQNEKKFTDGQKYAHNHGLANWKQVS